MESAKSRFLRYVTYYTTSDEFTGTSPSTERQKALGRALMQELEALKLEDVHMDDCGNVLATLPASKGVDAPVIALIAHRPFLPLPMILSPIVIAIFIIGLNMGIKSIIKSIRDDQRLL